MTEVYSLLAPETSIPTSMSVLSWWFSGRMCSMSSSCIWCCWKSLAFLGLQTGHPNNCLCLHLCICVYVSPFSLTGTLVRLGPILTQYEPHLDLIAFAKPHFQISSHLQILTISSGGHNSNHGTSSSSFSLECGYDGRGLNSRLGPRNKF